MFSKLASQECLRNFDNIVSVVVIGVTAMNQVDTLLTLSVHKGLFFNRVNGNQLPISLSLVLSVSQSRQKSKYFFMGF